MKAIFWLVVGFVALLGFTYYVAFGETGPIGWLNAGQVAVFGGYSRRLSMLVAMAVVAIPVVVVWAVVAPASLQGRARQASAAMEAPLRVPPRTGTAFKWLLLGWLGGLALVWGWAYGYGAWQQHLRHADAAAAYVPLELEPGMRDAAAGRDHLALRGRLLADHVVAREKGSNGSDAITLVPVVERGWREGDAVHFVVRFGPEGEPAFRRALRQPPASLLVRTDGAVPTLAGRVFERMRAPLADDALAVVLVEAPADVAAAGADGAADDVLVWGGIGTGIVTLVFMLFAAAVVGLMREERKRVAKAAV